MRQAAIKPFINLEGVVRALAMNRTTMTIAALLAFLAASVHNSQAVALADEAGGIPPECRMDFNADGVPDEVATLDTPSGKYLVVLISANEASGEAGSSFFAERDMGDRELSCHAAGTLRVKAEGEGRAITINTPGAYLELKGADGSRTVYVWNGKGFDSFRASD